VLTHYGPVFEVWFDGANGEGPSGKKQIYDWPLFVGTVRKYAPHAVIFSDGGPDIRWVGNENGLASESSWSMIPSNRYVPGSPYYSELGEGNPTGDMWCSPECDVSIRPGWFYHPKEEPKSPTELLDLFEKSVGRNGQLLLNVPPNRDGLIDKADEDSLRALGSILAKTYGEDLARGAEVKVDVSRGIGFDGDRVVDAKPDTYWAAPDGVNTAALKLTMKHAVTFDRVMLQEFIPLGQRVSKFTVSAWIGGAWKEVASGTTIGHERILALDAPATTDRVKIGIEASRACPTLTHVGLFRLAGQ
jgi:alpha-L-fucosidase